jgi:hypothetical protein
VSPDCIVCIGVLYLALLTFSQYTILQLLVCIQIPLGCGNVSLDDLSMPLYCFLVLF